MTRILYCDCFSGISGDMFLGALIDAGANAELLLNFARSLKVEGLKVGLKKVHRCHIQATKVDIEIPHSHSHRRVKDVIKMLGNLNLSAFQLEKSLQVINLIAQVEGKIHNCPPEEVTLHEIGAIDSIIDIVGAMILLESLNINQILCSPLNLGQGMIKTQHGEYPIPAPATAEILKDVPVYSSGINAELVTPTGAALMKTLACNFGPMPAMNIKEIGYGAGSYEFKDYPNLLRVFIGEKDAVSQAERIAILRTNLDDTNPQFYEHLMDKLFMEGALDVCLIPVIMKKSRPGIIFEVQCPTEKIDRFFELITLETSALGMRVEIVERKVLERKIEALETPYGPIKVKMAYKEGKLQSVNPEYDDLKYLAHKHNLSLPVVAREISHLIFERYFSKK